MNENPKQRWKTVPLNKILFIDVETATAEESFELLSPRLQELWTEKASRLGDRESSGLNEAAYYFKKASLYAEFGRVVCVSVGVFPQDASSLVVKSFAGIDEAIVLAEVSALLKKEEISRPFLCGHNIKEFDVPYLGRRMLINGLPIPPQLDLAGLKPWDVPHLDTMELWRFGDNKNYTKLELILEVLGIETSKDDISGAEVNGVFWNDQDLPRIVRYCEKDVIAVTNLFLRLRNLPILDASQITIREWSES